MRARPRPAEQEQATEGGEISRFQFWCLRSTHFTHISLRSEFQGVKSGTCAAPTLNTREGEVVLGKPDALRRMQAAQERLGARPKEESTGVNLGKQAKVTWIAGDVNLGKQAVHGLQEVASFTCFFVTAPHVSRHLCPASSRVPSRLKAHWLTRCPLPPPIPSHRQGLRVRYAQQRKAMPHMGARI